MSSSADFDEEASQRTFTAPYSQHRPVPTVQGYEARKEERQAQSEATAPAGIDGNASPTSTKSKRRSLLSSAKALLRKDSSKSTSNGSSLHSNEPYKNENRNATPASHAEDSLDKGHEHDTEKGAAQHEENICKQPGPGTDSISQPQPPPADTSSQRGYPMQNGQSPQDESHEHAQRKDKDAGDDAVDQQEGVPRMEDTSQAIENTTDPRQKRKNMKHLSRDNTQREVTDPVTHLPVAIHDFTNKELDAVPESELPPGTELRSATGVSGKNKSPSQIDKEAEQQQIEHRAMEKLFPPPSFDNARQEIEVVYTTALTTGLGSVLLVPLFLLVCTQLVSRAQDEDRSWLRTITLISLILGSGILSGGAVIFAIRGWLSNRIHSVWDDHLWDAARKQEIESSRSPIPESVQWLNSLLSSVWGIINPELFASLVDTLEDVMQASLPKLVRMISVEDLGQGSEAIRILGVRWLPTGAAAKSVSEDGTVQGDKSRNSDRKVAGEGQVDKDSKSVLPNESLGEADESKGGSEDQDVAESMEAEEGDFVNVEVAFSYRASTTSKSLHDKSKNAHLYLRFYLPGGIVFPVWVELRGIVGTLRMRLQLCPDPPFFALCTLTLLGQPKADLSCIPLTRKGLNIMDLPLISSFVQSSIDAALAEYVAPKSMTLDLKDMLVGDDFKKDTTTRGVIMVRIKRGRDFKVGDSGTLGLKEGSSDAYVAVGWAKFGKPVWSTRVIIDDMQPVWEEIAYILVGPEELNAEERLRVQLWDSDRLSADDDLGRVEITLQELMTSSQSKGKMWHRTDGFQSLKKSETMPGSIDWSVGYFPKARIQQEQLDKQDVEPEIRSLSALKEKVSHDAERKLREAALRGDYDEIDQQKAQDLKVREDAMIIATPPLHDHPTGILAIQVHEITGLEYEQINKAQARTDEGDDTAEGCSDLPSSYCTIIMNHQKIFKTRTKPKNAKPFFNAGTERLVRDWRTTEIMISVRDSRVHENDPLLGIVYLPLGKIFAKRSQVIENYPLVGGVGYGRARISMVFRSIELQQPKAPLGWDYGTVQITAPITSSNLSSELDGLRIKLRTSVNRAKMYTSGTDGGNTEWTGKKKRPVHLAVRKRYCSNMVIEFRKNSLGLDKTVAFGVLWLKDIPDEEEMTFNVPVWRADKNNMRRGESNVVDDLGERLGTFNIPIKFFRGLGAFHQKMASQNPSLQDVLEVLSTANDSKEIHTAIGGDHLDDSDSDSESSDDDEETASKHTAERKKNGLLKKLGMGDSDDENVNDGKGGPVQQFKDYASHSNQLHRENRGIMQYKVPRTADYMKTKVEHGRNHLMNTFKHHERDPGIETEV